MSLEIANTILSQLGGRRFVAMTGAKGFIGSHNSLSFTLPRGAKNGANKCRVTLDASDTYTVEFFRFSTRTLDLAPRGKSSDVYAEDLQEVFTEATGLFTHL